MNLQGQITLEEIGYCRRDAVCTLELLNALKREYDSFPISLRPERARPLRRTVIQAGIMRVVAPKATRELAERWEPVLKKARTYFTESGVTFE